MPEEILPGLFRIEIPLIGNPLKYLNSYVIKTEDRNLIIDTGFNSKECLQAMLEGLDEVGVVLEKTDFFITHFHVDHFGLVSRLHKKGAAIYFNRPDAELIEDKSRQEAVADYALRNGFPEDLVQSAVAGHPARKYHPQMTFELSFLKDGDKLEIGDYCFDCIETPGHSMGHICLYEPEKKILVSGDHILDEITPTIQAWSDEWNPLNSYLKSLDKVSGLAVDLVLPGHRRLLRNFKERIEELKRHHKDRADEVLLILQQGSRNAFQVASKMTWDLDCESWEMFPTVQKWFATGEAIAHLKYLEQLGSIYGQIGEKGVVYSLG
jgi:glyoxylase-like metal-dependent hydrolase (beta-lactamase superfamily II)